MAALTLDTRDYVLMSLDAAFAPDLEQAIFMRLNIQRGKYWANPNLGSRFYLLRRAKDVSRNVLLCKQYADEALEDLMPDRVASIVTRATQTVQSRVDLHIEVTHLSGSQQTILYHVPVGN